MAQLSGLQSYDKRLRQDLEELSNNLWFGRPVNNTKPGNLRGLYLIIDLTGISAGTTFGVKHSLGETPIGYIVIGTPTTEVITLAPGTDSGGVRIAWTSTRIYLKAPSDTNKTVAILLWAGDSSAE